MSNCLAILRYELFLATGTSAARTLGLSGVNRS
jgi:hypothetical protein